MSSPTIKAAGPPGRFLTGHVPELRADLFAFLTRCAAEYGDMVPIRLGPRRLILVNHPELIEEVLVDKPRLFIKHFALRSNSKLFGEGLLTSEGDFWLKQRRLIQPAFGRQRLQQEYAGAMVEQTIALRDGWADGRRVDMMVEMSALTLGIAARTLFSADAGDQAATVRHALSEMLLSFEDRIHSWVLLPLWIPTRANRRLLRSVNALDEIIYGYIKRRRQEGEGGRRDFLSMLLNVRDEAGKPMSDKQVRDEAMTLFLAGHETTALALGWTWYLLAKHPEVEARFNAELDEVLGGPDGRPPTAEDVARLPLTEHIILESMRLYPPVYLIGREAIEDVTIGGVRVKRGRTLWISEWVVHRDGRFFDRPEEFLPDRWDNDLAGRLPKFAYFPFGGGPRICIGNAFAMLELVLVMAALGQRYRCRVAPGVEVKPTPSFTLRPNRPMLMDLTRRS